MAEHTPGPWSFDGHGINDANGRRICKVTCCEPYTYDSGKPERNHEFDELSHLIKAASSMKDALFAIACMQITEHTDTREVLDLCMSIARVELIKLGGEIKEAKGE